MATLDQVISQMAAAGLPPVPADFPRLGRVVRFGPKKRAWYKLSEYRTARGLLYAGVFGVWRATDPQTMRVAFDRDAIEPVDRERIEREHREAEAREARKARERATFAARRALLQWRAARATGRSPYLEAKGLADGHKGLRYLADGTLLVPMVRYDRAEQSEADAALSDAPRLVGLQKIAPDGAKRFNAGMEKTGAACRLGRAPRDGEAIIVAEGVATALSIRTALAGARTVVVAFDAGSLLSVAKIFRELYPSSPILFAADDDYDLRGSLAKMLESQYGVRLDGDLPPGEVTLAGQRGAVRLRAGPQVDADGVEALLGAVSAADRAYPFAFINAGRTKAYAAMRAVGNACVVFPQFVERRGRWTDFNDLHQSEGLAAVRSQIESGLAALGAPPKNVRTEKSAALAAPAAGAKTGRLQVDWSVVDRIAQRYSYIYPTDTCYDHDLGDIVPIAGVRLLWGSQPVTAWMHSASRRVVDLPNVVFEPGASPRDGVLNLYRGLAVAPAKRGEGSCARLLELLHYLCGESDAAFDWVSRWLAYPLQHVGAKMESAIVMHGKEGAGKNLFFGAYADIFGQHATMIGQRQLETDFQQWLSAKLFVIANEVIARNELRHQVGFLKHLVTEPRLWINRKNRDERDEANHVNIVFFSNEEQPLQLYADDRRYMVIRTPAPRERAFYEAVHEEIRAGGVAALHRYLLDLDLDGFGPHEKPLETQAKSELIEIGMPSPQRYWKDIHDEVVDLPYCPALSDDVYRCYLRWCVRTGERMPANIARMVPEFMRLNGVRRAQKRLPRIRVDNGDLAFDLTAPPAQRRVLLMGDRPDGQDAEEWIQTGVLRFATAARRYCGDER